VVPPEVTASTRNKVELMRSQQRSQASSQSSGGAKRACRKWVGSNFHSECLFDTATNHATNCAKKSDTIETTTNSSMKCDSTLGGYAQRMLKYAPAFAASKSQLITVTR